MNLAEHPIALDLMKRLAASDAEDKTIPITAIMPGMGPVMGALRKGEVPGSFVLASNCTIQGTDMTGVMDFSFTADKPIVIIHPNLTRSEPVSRIVQ
jgi:hypothetical protein